MGKKTQSNGHKSALIYCRVSTKGQAEKAVKTASGYVKEEGTSLETQEEACIKQAESLGYAIGRVTKEVYSGAELFDRPLLSHDRSGIRSGQFQALICYAIDRLSRDIAHLAIIADECERAGCELIFVTENLDQSPEGKLLQSVRGYVAEVERQKIRERTLRGKKARLLSGRIHNSGAELYGYRRDKSNGVRVIYDEEAATIRRIYFDYVHRGKSISQIERELNSEGIPSPDASRPNHETNANLWHRKTIHRILTNPAYKGETIQWLSHRRKAQFGKFTVERRCLEEAVRLGGHVTPAIVSQEVWDMAQAIQRERDRYAVSANKRNERFPALLRGLVHCLECGEPMYVMDSGKVTGHYYRCASYYKPGKRGMCKSAYIRLSFLEAAVWEEIKYRMRDKEFVRRQLEAAMTGIPVDDTADAIAQMHG